MREVTVTTIRAVFPKLEDAESLLSRHAWRDVKYVGKYGGRIAAWRGWSANLAHVDPRYRNIYVDSVSNVLPLSEQRRIWGDEFADAVTNFDRFVVLFVSSLPLDSVDEIRIRGFVPRIMQRIAHGCIVVDESGFLSGSVTTWARHLERLVLLQRVISVRAQSQQRVDRTLHGLLYTNDYERPGLLVAEEQAVIKREINKNPDMVMRFPDVLPRSIAEILSELDLLEDLT